MARKINRKRLKTFILRRRANAMGLFALTALAVLVTLICALAGFRRTDVLIVVTALMMLLCAIQLFRMKRSFRTMRAFRGIRKKNK